MYGTVYLRLAIVNTTVLLTQVTRETRKGKEEAEQEKEDRFPPFAQGG